MNIEIGTLLRYLQDDNTIYMITKDYGTCWILQPIDEEDGDKEFIYKTIIHELCEVIG